MSIISTTNLTKTYSETAIPVKALQSVSIEFYSGEFTAIVGPSGCGKTTLLNMIGGLDRPTSGSVSVNNVKLESLSDNQLIKFRKQQIGFVFQSFNLIPVLTARENIEFVMMLQARSASERKHRSTELLKAFDMLEQIDKRPAQLSGGQQQRVAVARALASKPQFVLADEPTANLDSKSAEKLLDLMLEMNRQEGVTFIFSTHDERVIRKARRVVRLVDGEVVKDETVE